jgi:hypothetical protein
MPSAGIGICYATCCCALGDRDTKHGGEHPRQDRNVVAHRAARICRIILDLTYRFGTARARKPPVRPSCGRGGPARRAAAGPSKTGMEISRGFSRLSGSVPIGVRC